MRKNILAITALIALVSAGSSLTQTTFADSQAYGPGTITMETNSIPNQSVTLSDYMRSVYKSTQYPDLDESIYDAFKTFENSKNSSSMVTVYTGTLDDCTKFRDYFNLNYGYTNNLRLTTVKSGSSYSVAFMNTLNADARINEYTAEVEKAKSIAQSLVGTTNDETVNNVISWVKTNAKYYYGKDQSTETYISHYYGIYSQNEILCEGYAMAVYQLCAMNGIKASLVDLMSPNNIPHAVNQVTYSDKIRFVDTTRINPVSDELWSGYSYISSNMK